jgi:hypothetical protein
MSSLLGCGITEIPGEPVEPPLPEPAVPFDPPGGLTHRVRHQPAAPRPSIPLANDQSRPLQDAEVLRDGRKRHREGLRQLGDGGLALCEPVQDRPARGVGQRAEGRVEPRG